MRFRSTMLRLLTRFVPILVFACFALSAPAYTSLVAGRTRCGLGAELRLSSPQSSQGSLLLVEVRSAKPLKELKGEWTGNKTLFWMAQTAAKARYSVYRALLGVDLELAAGKYDFAVSAETQSGEKLSCHAAVTVNAGHFAIENLHVDKQFVQPDPEQLKRAQAEQERLREILGHVTPERLWQGNFRIPLDGVTTGKNFGKRRILNGQSGSPHGGVDLPATTGTPVYAAQRGRVVLAEELFFPGNTVVVDHGLGIYTFYGHLSEISVMAGEEVERGALLGKVGATGRVTGPHLHWGLTVNRARVDPLLILKLLPGEPAGKLL
jgi:murein DD-endopeptidase MepM/ murein hydrolase activator NlpD